MNVDDIESVNQRTLQQVKARSVITKKRKVIISTAQLFHITNESNDHVGKEDNADKEYWTMELWYRKSLSMESSMKDES